MALPVSAYFDSWNEELAAPEKLFTCFNLSSPSVGAMSKATVKKLHWRSKVQESFVPLGGASGELGVAIGGGADYGEFPFVTAAPGGGATVGDIILEIGGTPVLGMTLGDVRGVLNSCPHPIRIKTVLPGKRSGLIKKGTNTKPRNQIFMNSDISIIYSIVSYKIMIYYKTQLTVVNILGNRVDLKVQVGYRTGSSLVMMCTLEPCPDFIEDMIKKALST